MAVYSEIQMTRYNAENLPDTPKKLYNTGRELQEMQQFVLSNLDGDNIEGYEEIFNRLEGADGAISILKQTADEISAQVRKGAGQISIDYLNLSNNYGFITLGRGSAGTSSTRGILMCGPPISGPPDEYRNHFYASNAAARMTGEDMFGGESLYLCHV